MVDGRNNRPGLQRPRSLIHGIIGMIFAPIGMLAVLLEFAFPIAIVAAMFLLEHPWWQVGLIGLISWVLYKVFVQPLLMNGVAMITIWSCELPWPLPELAATEYPIERGRWALIVSAPIVAYSLVFFACVAAAWAFNLPRVPALIGLILLMTVTRFFLATQQAKAENRATIVLLRGFREHVTQWSLAGLVPTLNAYGQVRTVSDPTLDSEGNKPINPEDVPLGELDRVLIQGKPWKPVVKRMIQEADCVLIDVTEPSLSIGWEIACASDSTSASNVVLVCQPQALMPTPDDQPLFNKLVSSIEPHRSGPEAEQIVRSLNPPLIYTDDLSNLVFCWRLYRRLKSVSRKRAPGS